MASVFANYSFDQRNFDLNEMMRTWLHTSFFDDSYYDIDNRLYSDDYEVIWDRDGIYRYTLFMGDNLTVDGQYNLTGGTVTGLYELTYTTDFDWQWGIRDFSMDAATLYAATQTVSTADDFALLQQILAGNDRFDLSNGADRAYGYAGNDRMLGLAGNDTLEGGSGNDSLYGGTGSDRIVGGAGKDLMSGSTGSDVFIFRSASETRASSTYADVITDFNPAYDRISLSAIDAFAPTATNNTFVWRGTGGFTSATAGEVRYKQYDLAGTTSDYTMVYIDTDGDSTAEAAIRLNGLKTLVASDFIL